MIGSFCKMPVAQRLTNHVIRVEHFTTFTFAWESRGFIRMRSGVSVILFHVKKARCKHTEKLIDNASGRIKVLCDGRLSSGKAFSCHKDTISWS